MAAIANMNKLFDDNNSNKREVEKKNCHRITVGDKLIA